MGIQEADLQGRLLFAVPKKGRIHEQTMALIKNIGLKYYRSHRTDIALCTNENIAFVFLSASDIALYVGQGRVDLGITGQDMVAEKAVAVKEICKLGYGKCKLCVQAPVKNKVTDVKSLVGKRIVTSFPNLAEDYFDKLNPEQKTTINYVSGSVEAACALGLADGIVDLVETGETMRAAGLEVVSSMMDTESVLIANPVSDHNELIDKLKKRVQGAIHAKTFVLIEYCVSRENLPMALKLTPGHTSATVMPLDDPKWVAVKSMISRKEHNVILDELMKIGAKDALVGSIENCRLSV